jgi:putative oxidoreductase
MSEVSAFWSRWSAALLSVLRIVVAFLFMQHGAQKLFGVPGGGEHKVELASLIGFAGCLEFVGGGLILLGLFTRPVAFVLAGEMAFAYFMAHAPQGFWPVLNQGELAVFYCFTFLYLSAAGGGPWSLDRLLHDR